MSSDILITAFLNRIHYRLIQFKNGMYYVLSPYGHVSVHVIHVLTLLSNFMTEIIYDVLF